MRKAVVFLSPVLIPSDDLDIVIQTFKTQDTRRHARWKWPQAAPDFSVILKTFLQPLTSN